jgi:hypothetical protein
MPLKKYCAWTYVDLVTLLVDSTGALALNSISSSANSRFEYTILYSL